MINPVHGNNHRRSDMAWKDCFLLRLPKKMGASFFYGSSRPPHSWLSISPVGNEFANIFLFLKKRGRCHGGTTAAVGGCRTDKNRDTKKALNQFQFKPFRLAPLFLRFCFFFPFPPSVAILLRARRKMLCPLYRREISRITRRAAVAVALKLNTRHWVDCERNWGKLKGKNILVLIYSV